MRLWRCHTALVCAGLLLGLTVPCSAQQAGSGSPAAPNGQFNLDLTSTAKNVSAASVLAPSAIANIKVGGTTTTVTTASMLTAAEMVAVRQVFATGRQFLQLNNLGAAVGGGMRLNYYASNGISNLVIPSGVRALQNAAALPVLNVIGNLTNSGTLKVFSSNSAVNAATISAANIYNNAGALISSTLQNLSLNAANNIFNAGTISSAANLSMSAGNAITNQSLISAAQHVNIFTGFAGLTNSGTISSLSGNVNISSMVSQDMVVNNANGSIQALLGSINISNMASLVASNLSVTGGDFLSKELNINANGGKAGLNVNKLTGVLNIDAGSLDVTANTDTLQIGNVHVTGDPQFFNPSGDIQITGNLLINPFTAPGDNNLEIAASGNIYTSGGNWQISTGNTSNANSGNILMVAGVSISSSPSSGGTGGNTGGSGTQGTSLTFNGVSSTGGYIDLTGGGQNPITQLDTSCNGCTGGSGGSVTLVAYYNSASPGSTTTPSSGTILIPPSVTITTFTSANVSTAQNGNVIIMAGAPSNPQTSNTLNPNSNVILLGGINTSGNTVSPVISNGLINIIAGNPSYLIAPNNNTQPNTQNLINGGAQAGQTFIPVTDFTGISAGQSLVLNPTGANAETVQVASGYTGGYNVTLANPTVFNHGSQEYVLTSSSTLTTAQDGGNPAGAVIPQNGGAFYVGSSTSTGSISVGAINAGANVVISTGGTVNLTGSVALTQNPIPTSNYNNAPVLQITGQQVTIATGTTVSTNITGCSPCLDVLNIYTPNLTNNGTISGSYVNIQSTTSGVAMALTNTGTISGVNPNAMVNIQSAGGLVLSGTGSTISVPALSVIAISAADTNTITFNNTYTLSGGANGLVTISAEGAGGAVNIAANKSLQIQGGLILSISTPNLNFNSGSSIQATGSSNFIFTSGALVQSPQPLTVNVTGSAQITTSSATSIILRPTDGQNINFTGSGSLSFSGAPVYLFTGTSNGVAGAINLGSVALSSVSPTYQAVDPNGGITGIAFQPYVGGITSGTEYTLFSTYTLAQVLVLMAQIAQTGMFQSLGTYSQGATLALNGLDPTVSANYVINGAAMYTIQAAKQLGLQVTAGAYVQLSNSKAIQVAGTEVEINYAIQQAKTYGNVMDLVVGNECIVNPRDASTTSLIQAINYAQIQRNAQGFTAQTLPVTTRQTYGVLSGASTSQSTVDLLNGCTGCGSTYGLTNANFEGVDGHVYADVYPYYDSPIVGYLNSTAQYPWPPPTTSISQGNFQTLVTNNPTPTQLPAPAPSATGIQQDLNGTLSAFQSALGGVAITPQLWVAETGWATSSTPASDAPVASTQFATWYYPDMQSWSKTNQTIANPAPSYTIPIKGYFEAFNEPWKTVANDTTGQGGEPHFGVWVATGSNILQPNITPGFVLTGISQKFSLPVFNQQPGPIQSSGGLPSPSPQPAVETNTSSDSLLSALLSASSASSANAANQISSRGAINPLDTTPVGAVALASFPIGPSTQPWSQPSPTSKGANASASTAKGIVSFDSNTISTLRSQGIQIGANTSGSFLQLQKGNLLLSPNNAISIGVNEGSVKIAGGSMAFVMETGNDVAVYNLYDRKSGDVSVVAEHKTIALPPGKMMVLTRNKTATFDEVNPGKDVATRNPQRVDVGDGIIAYMADFSFPSALSSLGVVKGLLKSPDSAQRHLAQNMIKLAAIQMLVATGPGSFKRPSN